MVSDYSPAFEKTRSEGVEVAGTVRIDLATSLSKGNLAWLLSHQDCGETDRGDVHSAK